MVNKLIEKAKLELENTLKERGQQYGDFYNIASFCDDFYINNMQYIIDKMDSLDIKDFKSAKLAIFMLGVKLARIENNTKNLHYDSVLDFLGYLELLKRTHIKGLQLKANLECSSLHKKLIEYANNELNENNTIKE